MRDSLLKFVSVNKKSLCTLFIFSISYLVYNQAIERKCTLLRDLQAKKSSLADEKVQLVERRRELLLELASCDDPAWVELSLMRKLGVVPEGQVKVHFSDEI